MSPEVIDDFVEVHSLEMGAESNRSTDSYSLEQFSSLYLLILRNQSSYFREIYNGKKDGEIDIQLHLKENNDNVRLCFEAYDVDRSGYLSFMEMQALLMEMNLHKQFSKHFNPQYAFEDFCVKIWRGFDKDNDGVISFEEFIHVFNHFQ